MSGVAFDLQLRTRLVVGPDTSLRVGELARELPSRRALLVTDAGLEKAGHAERVTESLRKAGIEVVLFDKVIENPTTRTVDECLAVAKDARIDAIIGLGGGSSMDTAKGCNFLLTNGGRMQDYWGYAKARQPMLPWIAIPTTTGTGSECQSYALIADETTHQKMACGDPKAAARVAILDPRLAVTQPQRVAAAAGIDALAHAVETAVTKRRNEMSALFSREAYRLISANLSTLLARPDDLEACAAMQLGAALAGMAIENSMLGAAHSAANPLTAHHGIPHGFAVGIMLPHVVRFNAADSGTRALYEQLTGGAAEELAGQVESHLDAAGIPRTLTAHKIPPSEIPMLAEEAAKQWTAQFNPRSVEEKDFVALYEAAR